MGDVVVAIQTLNGIAIAVESPHLASPKDSPNVFPVNRYTVLGYHESTDLGQQMFEMLLQQQVDLESQVLAIADQAADLFDDFVRRKEIQGPIGFLFLGYADGKGVMRGWFHADDRTKRSEFFPFCTSRTMPIAGYLIKKLYTPDISLARALELAAYIMTQSRIVLSQKSVFTHNHLNLAAIHPDQGFLWLERKATESILRMNEERDRELRIKCADLFVDEA